MKHVIMVLIIFNLLIISGCNSGSVGIIGGADGPTSVFVSEKSEEHFGKQQEKKTVRMFNADGELYYDSGLFSKITSRCGTVDGEFTKKVRENEIPLNPGEANFKAEGYQNSTSITKEVNIDGKWVIFKKYDLYNHTTDGLKFCYRIKGRLNNAAADSEIIVLCEKSDVTFNDVYVPLLSSQSAHGEKREKILQNFINGDKWGVILFAENITPDGLKLKIEQFGGEYKGELQTGADYGLEMIVDDEWQEVKTKSGKPLVWNSLAYMIKKNDITEMNIDWKYAYGELKPGYYRLKKSVTDFRATGDYDVEIYEVYFSIE